MKKAESLSINVIVLAALALIVLVVMAMFLGKNYNLFSTTASSCQTRGGVCGTMGDENCKPPYYVYVTGTQCDKENGDIAQSKWTITCCVPLMEKEDKKTDSDYVCTHPPCLAQ